MIAGLEPASDSALNAYQLCGCEKCRSCRAALALHKECIESRLLASLDIDLQHIIAAWEQLLASIKKAIRTLVNA